MKVAPCIPLMTALEPKAGLQSSEEKGGLVAFPFDRRHLRHYKLGKIPFGMKKKRHFTKQMGGMYLLVNYDFILL